MKSVNNFIAVVGDKAIKDITGDDMLDFRNWWMERLEEEDLTPNSANKDLFHLGDVLKTVNRMKRLGLVLPLFTTAGTPSDAISLRTINSLSANRRASMSIKLMVAPAKAGICSASPIRPR
jgi:hypothetical protein